MFTSYKTEIEGHTVEVRYSGTGSHDPWSGKYLRDNNIGLMCTADVAHFALVDGDTVYKLSWRFHEFCDANFERWDDALQWLKENSEDEPYSLKERIEEYSKLKGKW